MSRGLGRVERAIKTLFAERGAFLVQISTEEVCRVVFNTPEVTKAQRVAVLRAMKQMVQHGTIKRFMPPNTRIVRSFNRRFWFIQDNATKQKKPSTKLASVVRLLGSDKQGERDAAVLAMQRLMETSGMDWNDLAHAIENKLSGRTIA
jgi:hypothetical protein